MESRRPSPQELAGSLLLAHPSLHDPNFSRTVVLLSAHNEEGAMGVVLNRPLQKKLGDLNESFAASALSDVPLYYGGPVNPNQVLLVAWETTDDEQTFKLYFGLDPEKAEELLGGRARLRAFLGYSGWTGGQLEGELKQKAWVVSQVAADALNERDGPALWRLILTVADPQLSLEADEPEDPSLN